MSTLVKKPGSPFYYARFYVKKREYCISTKIRFNERGGKDKASRILAQLIQEKSGGVSIASLSDQLLEAIQQLPEAKRKWERQNLIARLSVRKGENMSLDEVWRKWTATFEMGKADPSGEKQSRWNRFKTWLEQRKANECTVGWISSDDASDYMAHLNSKGLSRHTVCVHIQTIRQVLDDTKKDTGLLSNPFSETKPRKTSAPSPKKKPLSEDEIRELLAVLDPRVLTERDATLPPKILANKREWHGIAMVGANTGLRLKDCVMLNREDLLDEMTTITVLPGKMARRGEKAKVTIPVTTKLRECLDQITPAQDGSFFPVLKKRYEADRSALAKDFAHILQSIGLTTSEEGANGRARSTLGFHSIRYRFVTELRRRGADPHVVQKMVGHTSLEMTNHYTEVDQAQKESALRLLE